MRPQTVEWIERVEQMRTSCLDRAAVIAALALARLDEHNLAGLSSRQDEQLRDNLIDFAFRARKLIETLRRAECLSAESVHDPAIISSPAADGVFYPTKPPSFVDILGRMIHSDHFEICRAPLPLSMDTTTPGSSGWSFSVASDRDKNGARHVVFVEYLLRDFVEFDTSLGLDLRLLRKWASAG